MTARDVSTIRALLVDAFERTALEDGAFDDADWDHALGGVHVILENGAEILAHAAVVERTLEIAGRPIRTGYVEAVATKVGRHGQGHGSTVMGEVNDIIRAGFELGALGTGRFSFYERLGWVRWRGSSSVRMPDGRLVATPEDDGYLLVLRTPSSPPLGLDAPISCAWRPGDVW